MQRKEGCRITGILLCVIRMDTRLSTSSASKEAARLFAGRSEAPRHPRGGADRLSARDAPAHLQKTARASDRRHRRSFPATKKTASCPFYTTRKWSTAAGRSARQADIPSSLWLPGFFGSAPERLSHASPPTTFRLLYFEKSLHFNHKYRIIYYDITYPFKGGSKPAWSTKPTDALRHGWMTSAASYPFTAFRMPVILLRRNPSSGLQSSNSS